MRLLAAVFLTSAAQAQGLSQVLSPSDPDLRYFGSELAVDGDHAAVHARDGLIGRVLLYSRLSGTWTPDGELPLPAPPADLRFGSVLALDGDRLAVGVPELGEDGAVHVYERIGGSWVLDAELLRDLPFTQAGTFPVDLALDGDRLAVSWSTGGQFPNGGVDLYERTPAGWELADGFPLEMPGFALSDSFGARIELEGPQLVVAGTDLDSDLDRVYSYRETPTGWILEQTLTTPEPTTTTSFGSALDLEGERLLVADSVFQPSGAVFVYRRTDSGWEQEGERLRIPGIPPGSIFARRIALRDSTIAISAVNDGPGDQGTVFTFHRTNGVWRPTGAFGPSLPASFQFGEFLAFAGEELFVGQPGSAQVTFPVSVLSLPVDAIPYGTCLVPDAPCGNPDVVAGCATSLGEGATLRASGSTSVAADELILRVDGVVPGQFGLLYMGAAAAGVPFGDGLRVVGPGAAGLFRYPIQQSGPGGSFQRTGLVAFAAAGFGSAGTISAGSQWFFQAWFRDPAGPCGSGFNLSPGLRVRFRP